MEKYIVNKDKFGWNNIDGDFLMYSTHTEQYHVLNEEGKIIFEIILNSNEPISLNAIVVKFSKIYNTNNISVEEDIKAFIQKMCDADIVKVIK